MMQPSARTECKVKAWWSGGGVEEVMGEVLEKIKRKKKNDFYIHLLYINKLYSNAKTVALATFYNLPRV